MDAAERGEKLIRIETIVVGLKDTIEKQESNRKERDKAHELRHKGIDENLALHNKFCDRGMWLGGILLFVASPFFYFGVKAVMAKCN